MRIISGVFRGRKLEPTKLKNTRPTTDFAREGLFNMLNSRLQWEGKKVLDLYTGSGAIVFEFLSRGVESAVAVDSFFGSVKFINGIKDEWGVENLDVVKSDSINYLKKCHLKFDVIFADPPYNENDYDSIHRAVFERDLLNQDAILILEHGKRSSLDSLTGFQFQRSFGNVNFSFFSQSK